MLGNGVLPIWHCEMSHCHGLVESVSIDYFFCFCLQVVVDCLE